MHLRCFDIMGGHVKKINHGLPLCHNNLNGVKLVGKENVKNS
jgi:hypothetical protein